MARRSGVGGEAVAELRAGQEVDVGGLLLDGAGDAAAGVDGASADCRVGFVELDVVAEGVEVGGLDAEAGLDVQAAEVDGVHQVAGGDLLDGVEDVGIAGGGGLDAVDVAGEVLQGVGLD